MIKNHDWLVHLMRATPCFAAMFFQADVMGRWWLAAVASALVLLHAAFQWTWKINFRTNLWMIVISVAALVLPTGYRPAIGVLAPVFGSLALNLVTAYGVLFVGSKKYYQSYLFAWGMIGLSIRDQPTFLAMFLLCVFGVALLIVAAHDAGVFKQRRRVGVVCVAFILVTGIASFELASFTRVAQSAIQNAISSYYELRPIAGVSGLGENIYIGSRGNMLSSPAEVLELSRPVTRLRAKVFDRFDGIRWTSSPELQKFVPQKSVRGLNQFDGERLEYIWLEKPATDLPTPAGTIHVLNDTAVVGPGWIYQLSDSPSDLELIVDPEDQLQPEKISPESMLAVPTELQEELRSFGTQLLGKDLDAISKGLRLQEFFQQNYTYSLTTDFDTKRHPVLEMLKPGTAAYCVHFASTMALVLRMQDVPTRLVTGYLPSETNAITNRTMVRKRDAHAWVEVWSHSEQKFIPFDPTPMVSRNRLLGLSSSRSWMLEFFGAVRSYLLRTWVLSGNDPQLFVTRLLRAMLTYLWLPIMVTLLALVIHVWSNRRRLIQASFAIHDEDVARAYDCFLRSLRARKVRMDANESDTVVIERLRDAGFLKASRYAEEFLHSYRRIRFGDCPYEPFLLGLAEKVGRDE